jgi:kumamolisin
MPKKQPTQSPRKNMALVQGSNRDAMAGAKDVGGVNPKDEAEVTLRVRSRMSEGDLHQRLQLAAAKPPSERTYLSRTELTQSHGASPEDLAKIDQFAHDHHLTVVESSIPKRMVRLRGALADLQTAFGVTLRRYRTKQVTYRGRTGPVYVPKELAGIVEGVFGLDDRPVAKPHYRKLGTLKRSVKIAQAKKPAAKSPKKAVHRIAPKAARDTSFSVPEILKLYNFPAGLDGTGQTIALLELNTPADPSQPNQKAGAGYTNSDLKAFFSKLKLKTPAVSPVSVDGGANLPGLNPNADGEVTLDIEVAGAAAPGASIAVYFAPNTDKGFIDVITSAVHDEVRKPTVLSISWGGPEDSSTQQFLNGVSSAISDASLIGMTVCVASGDSGSSDLSSSDGGPHVDFPASSPYSLACGGTTLTGNKGTIGSEVVWNEGRRGGGGGGGVSTKFPLPAYQQNASIPKSPKSTTGRGVPDVAGNGDPQTGYQIILGGKEVVIGGTSAVAPLWAGLVARINQQLAKNGAGPVGFLNTTLYQLPDGSKALRDITEGTNDIDGDLGVYAAATGWDACTGLGTPDGQVLLEALTTR